MYLWQKIKEKFVQKESGKGLSTNEFTTDERFLIPIENEEIDSIVSQ